jgi:glycosyltransferase involved in cell wall biosynthesis
MASVAMVVSNACDPDPRVLRSAKVLADMGHDVTVHCFDRIQGSAMSESISGVRIMRYHIGQFSYGAKLATVRGLRLFNKTVIATLLANTPQCIYCHDADTLSVGVKVAKKTSAKVVFDMHDLHHTWALMGRPKSMIRKAVSAMMERKMLRMARACDLVVTSSSGAEGGPSPGFREYLDSKEIASIVVENRPYVQNNVQKKAKKADSWTVGYLGRIRELESFELLMRAIEAMPAEVRPDLKLAGDGTAVEPVQNHMMLEASRLGVHLSLSGGFRSRDMQELISDVDVMYAMYPPNRGNIMQGALPVKMFDAASFGVPTIVNAHCLMGDVCIDEELGGVAPWNDVDALAEGLLALKDVQVILKDHGEAQRKRFSEAMEALL